MSAGPRLSRLAAKDVRALAPVWIVCLAAMAASGALNLTPFRGFGVVLFFFVLAALGALSFGHEYQHGTMALLLSLPAQRTRLFPTCTATSSIARYWRGGRRSTCCASRRG